MTGSPNSCAYTCPRATTETFRRAPLRRCRLYTAWAAVQQWAAQGLDEPLEPIVTKAFGLAATAARDVQEAMRPERGKG
ncbi:hypothetical protein [Streptomyces sp.]